MSREVRVVWPLACELGEGPVWLEGVLWFVDIKGQQVHAYEPASDRRRSWPAPAPIGFLLPTQRGDFVAGLKSGLHRFDPASGSFSKLTEVEPPVWDNRLNDGAVDADGYLWFGSMHDPEATASGSLYRLDDDGVCRARDAGYVVTNGPTFSLDGRTLYHTDTLARVIYAFDCAPGGALSNKRRFIEIARAGAYPDGAVTDSDGCIWTGLFCGWGVERYSPQGELLEFVEFPCSRVTKIAFGGDDLRTAYATTAWKGLSNEDRAKEPLAGALFAFDVDTPGVAATKIRHGLG